jgi:hypothetical protein
VINFILRKDYRGAEVGANYYSTDAGGGDNWRANIAAGWGDLAKDGFNAFLTLDHFRQDPLAAVDREFSRTAYLPWLGRRWHLEQLCGRPTSGQPGGFGGRPPRNPTVPITGPTAASCLPPYSFPDGAFRDGVRLRLRRRHQHHSGEREDQRRRPAHVAVESRPPPLRRGFLLPRRIPLQDLAHRRSPAISRRPG